MTIGRLVVLVLALALGLAACGEPPLDVTIPDRDPGRHVADLAGVLAADTVEAELAGLDTDVVVLTYTTEQANCGEAFRAGREFVAAWQADVAIVAVAVPGGFDDVDAERCVGLQPLDDFELGRGTREDITEVRWPPLIEANEWTDVVLVGARELDSALGGG